MLHKHRYISLVLVVLLLPTFAFSYYKSREAKRFALNDRKITSPSVTATVMPVTESASPFISATPSPTATVAAATPTPTPVATVLSRVNLDVPFTIQAPTSNWDEVHEETCEEASLLMASWWATGKIGEKKDGYANRIPQATAESDLQELVQWQKDTFGYFEDTTAEETVRMAKEKLKLKNVSLLTDVTEKSLKQVLSEGKLIVAPAAGQVLNNPNFKQPGPPYHMFVVRGYNDNGFITNDPGTRRGEGFVYTYDNLIDSVHDWTGRDSTMLTGKKVVIVIEKES